MVHSYENASYAFGEKSTFFWLRPYEEFLQFYSSDGEDEVRYFTVIVGILYEMINDLIQDIAFTYKNIPDFLNNDMYQYYKGTLRYTIALCSQFSDNISFQNKRDCMCTERTRMHWKIPLLHWIHDSCQVWFISMTIVHNRFNLGSLHYTIVLQIRRDVSSNRWVARNRSSLSLSQHHSLHRKKQLRRSGPSLFPISCMILQNEANWYWSLHEILSIRPVFKGAFPSFPLVLESGSFRTRSQQKIGPSSDYWDIRKIRRVSNQQYTTFCIDRGSVESALWRRERLWYKIGTGCD